jgi:hypothetical protein
MVSMSFAQNAAVKPQEMQRQSISQPNAVIPTGNVIDFGKGPNSDVYYGQGTPSTFYKATVSNIIGVPIGTANRHVQASEYVDGVLYGVTYDPQNRFGTVNLTNGQFTQVVANLGNDAMSMCYNPTNGLTYVFAWGGAFGTVNLATGAYTNLGSVGSNNFYAAIDNDGICYGIPLSPGSNAPFGTINLATGVFTQKGTIPFNTNYIQEMSIDRETNKLYWLATEYISEFSSNNYYYEVNKETGALTLLGTPSFSGNAQVFAIATTPVVEICDPISNLVLTPSDNSVMLSWTAAPGTPTGYRISYNGDVLTTVTGTAHLHTDVPDGLHVYSVAAIYSSGCTPFDVTETVIVGDLCMFRFEMDVDPGTHPEEPGVIFGWNGTYIEVSSGGIIFGEATVSHSSLAATAFILVPSGTIEFRWGYEGNYSYFHDQASFTIYNSKNELIYTQERGTIIDWDHFYLFFTYDNDCTIEDDCDVVIIDAVKEENNIRVTWSAPSEGTINIIRNGENIAENVPGTSWLDESPIVGNNCYQAQVVCEAGNTMSAPACVQMGNSIKENIKTGFSIAPNPAKDNIKISATNNFHTVEVVSFLGQTVLSQANVGKTAEVNVSNLTQGVYFVRIITDNGTTVQKFVKQ